MKIFEEEINIIHFLMPETPLKCEFCFEMKLQQFTICFYIIFHIK